MPRESKIAAADSAQKKVLQFSKDNTMQAVSDDILEQYSNHTEEFKTALKNAFENADPPATALELPEMKKAVINKRRAVMHLAPLIQNNAIDNAWNELTDIVREKAISAYTEQSEKRKADVSSVFKEIIDHRLGADIIAEVKLGVEWKTALLKGDLMWLIKKIRQVKSLGVTFESNKRFKELQKLKQGNISVSAHLQLFSNGVSELIRAGWSRDDLTNAASVPAIQVKDTLLDSLTLKEGQSVLASEIVEIRNNSTWTFEEISSKLIKAEADQAEVDSKINQANKRANVTKRETEDETKDEKELGKVPRGARGRNGKPRGGGRGDGAGRGGRVDDNNSRNSGRGRGGHRGGGRGDGGRGRGSGGHNQDEKEDRGRDDDWDRRGDDYRGGGGRGRGGRGGSRGGGRSSYNSGSRGDRWNQDREDSQSSSWRSGDRWNRDRRDEQWRNGGQPATKRTRFEDSQKYVIVCRDCTQVQDNCECGVEDNRSRGGRSIGGPRGGGRGHNRQVGMSRVDEDPYDWDEGPYQYEAHHRNVNRAGNYSHSAGNTMVQFDTAADLFVLNEESNHLQVQKEGPALSITGITGQTVTPSKSGKVGVIEAVLDERFSNTVAPGLALVKANPGCGVLMTSEGLQVIDGSGMGKIRRVINANDVIVDGVVKNDGWYMTQQDVRKLAEGTPRKSTPSMVMHARAGWAKNDDRVIPSPTTESYPVRVVNRRRRTQNLQPTRPATPLMTPAAMKLATEVQQLRDALHPSDAQLHFMLDNKLVDTQASAKDATNAIAMFGPDAARLQAVIKNPSQYKVTQNHPATEVGEVVSGDLHVLGRNNLLSMVDHLSAYQHIEPLGPTKTTKSVEAGINMVVNDYNQNSHRVQEIRFDSEANLVALKAPQAQGINVTHAPPGAHETFAESYFARVQEKYLTMLNAFPYKFDERKHPHMGTQLMKTAADILNVLPNKRTGPMHTPYELFTGKRFRLKAENMVPIGTIALFKDWNAMGLNQNKTRAGIIVGYNLTCPGNFYVYDPTTGRKPELEFLASNKHIIDHDAAMRLVDQWDGFKRQATLNLPIQPVVAPSVVDYTVPAHQSQEGAPALTQTHVQEGAPALAQARVQDLVHDQIQEGAQVQVDVQAQAQVGNEGTDQEGAAPDVGDMLDGNEAPHSPVGGREVPPEPPPVERGIGSQPAPQQEGESVGPAAQDDIAVDLRAAFFTLKEQNGAVVVAEVNHVLDMMEAHHYYVNASKKNASANSGTQLYRKYERENPEALESALRTEIENLSKRMLGHAVPSHTLSVKEMRDVVHTMVCATEREVPSVGRVRQAESAPCSARQPHE